MKRPSHAPCRFSAAAHPIFAAGLCLAMALTSGASADPGEAQRNAQSPPPLPHEQQAPVQQARDEEAPGQAHGAHHEAYPNLVGLRVGQLAVSEPRPQPGREVRSFVFIGLSYERTLIHRWLEAEISVPVAVSPGEELEVAMPFDLHFKIPFHPAPDLSPYLAAGPSLDLVVAPETEALLGASFALGTYAWFSDRIGADIELDYNVVYGEHALVHEFLLATGPVTRF